MEIKCVNAKGNVEWTRQTPETSWQDTVITPVKGENWVTRTTVEEPSGFVESVLIKKEMRLNDRGMYICRDIVDKNANSFSIWVTTLQSKYKYMS